jgi:hemerythrin
MNYVKWENDYNTGDDRIDEQHQRVFIFINKLNLALRTTRDREEILDIMRGLKDYSDYHFKMEEDQMIAANYPKLDAHKAEHQIFIDRLTKLTSDMENRSTTINLRLLKFLKVWFSGHILNTDKKFIAFLSEGIAD